MKLNGGIDGQSIPANSDFEEFQKVMQPRTAKGPSWVNGPQPQPQAPVKKAGGVDPKDNQMDVGPAPSQDALSDLEWMKQRMAKSAVQDSDTITSHPDPTPQNVTDINQVRLRE